MDMWSLIVAATKWIISPSLLLTLTSMPRLKLQYGLSGRFCEPTSRWEPYRGQIRGTRIRLLLYNRGWIFPLAFPAKDCAVYIDSIERDGVCICGERLQLEWSDDGGFEKCLLGWGKKSGRFVDICFSDDYIDALQVAGPHPRRNQIRFDGAGRYRLRIGAKAEGSMLSWPARLVLDVEYRKQFPQLILRDHLRDRPDMVG